MKKKIKYLLLSVAILFFLSCTNKKNDDSILPKPAPVTTNSNLRLSGAVKVDGNYKFPVHELNSFFIRYFPNETTRRPLIISFHGGGFFFGQKESFNLPLKFDMTGGGTTYMDLITEDQLDAQGFAYASINYRLLTKNNGLSAIDCLADGKEFLNYIINNASTYHIDPNKIILLGYSGGADIALWLGLQNNNIKGIVAMDPQATMNILQWRNQVFAPFNTQNIYDDYLLSQLATSYGGYTLATYSQAMYGTTNPAKVNNYCNTNNLNLFNLFDSSDPELYLANGALPTDVIHAGSHVWALKQKSAAAGHNAQVQYVHGNWGPDYWNPNQESVMQFCIRKFQ